MAANRSPAPVFETDDDRTATLIRPPVHPLAVAADGEAAQVTDQVAPEVARLWASGEVKP